MSYTKIKTKDREEWLREREGGIGSSAVGTILGLSHFETPYQLWARKKGLLPKVEENTAMLMGHLLENAVAERFQHETGNQIIKNTAGDWIAVDNNNELLRVSPDRLAWIAGEKRNANNKMIVECKTTSRKIDTDTLPKTWICQLMYQLGVMEIERGALAWLVMDATRGFGYKYINYDKDLYMSMVDYVTKWWKKHIVDNVPPPPTNVEDVVIMYPKHFEGKTIEANADIVALAKELKDLRNELAEKDAHKKEIEDKIKLTMQDAEALTFDDNIIATWKASADTEKFNVAKFKKDHPKLYAEYCNKVQGSRRFLLK